MAEITTTISATIESLLELKKYNSLKDILTTIQPIDIALILEEMPIQKVALIFRLLPKELAAEVFVEMENDSREALIKSFSDNELKEIIDELYLDDAVDLVEEMPASVVRRILAQADPDTRRLINEMLKYPEDSAGSVMTTEFVDLLPDMTAADAILRIRRTGVDKETINVCYVIDGKRKLIGAVSIRAIILASEDAVIEEIMDENILSVTTQEDQETVAQMFAKYNFTVMPVVDAENRLVGIVTVDDAIDIIQEEATEDISKMAGVTPSDKPYLKLSVFEIWKSRIPWLMALMLSATLTSIILTSFEGALLVVPVLTAYIPMLMGTGGNSGSQASVTVTRGLSLSEIEFSDLASVLWKEVRVSVLCGASLAIVNFLKLLLIDRLEATVALTICVTLIFVVFFAKLVGALIPMLAEKFGFDPAVMASPFITTIVDALSLLIYFGVAKTVLGI
ncbi:MAG: magnesium transporter [Clostridia bacterium]|nr:magnesium transporter [Oscillospiraceae bacterium]MBQ6797310.1 magnesium transporter [Clostridia bacterium]